MNIGLIAHDAKKKLMQNFCIAYRGILSKNELYATGTTGRLIEEVTNLTVHKYRWVQYLFLHLYQRLLIMRNYRNAKY